MIVDNYIEESIIIEKYLINVERIMPNDYSVKNYYDEIVKKLPSNKQVPFDKIKPFAFCIALFNHERTKELVNNKSYEREKQEYNYKKKREYWSFKDLMINGEPDICIATEPDSGVCIIAVKDFNAAAKLSNIPKYFPKDTANNQILKRILKDIYFERQAQLSGYTKEPDFNYNVSKRMEMYKSANSFFTLGRPVTDEESLWVTYAKYYDKLFCKKEDLSVDIIGSSDSVYIDSLYNWLYQTTKNDSIKTQKEHSAQIISKLPWQKSNWEYLPDELVVPTDSLNESGFTKPIKTLYGHFIARVDKITKIDEISFEEARWQLIYLATRDKWENQDSILEAKAYQIYEKNKSKYVTPDTLIIEAILLPYFDDSTKIILSNNKDIKSEFDAKHVKKLSFYSTSVPAEIKQIVEKEYNAAKTLNKLLGPIYTRYGAYYFKVKKAKSGRKQLPFRRAYNDIVYEIEKNIKRDSTVLQKEIDNYLMRKATVSIYIKDKLDINEISDNELLKLIENGKIDIPYSKNMSSSEKIYHAKIQYKNAKGKKIEQNINEWIKTIKINKQAFN